ncbi:MAG: ABC transporter permease [Candidatus Parabeggiatoa sp. nov. 3]|nr:MAG: ABC transporter permease [Gammaproteobacteria bacterium]RKZ62396.1 MAG: ABC transporter permease [Gammaproteobacteria bacterium]RKZ84265.1 MAG: ABC transporter permease [Gammaproteobacteria bacterium]
MFNHHFTNVSRYTELILYKTYADLKAETERTYLGFLWWIFEPIMYMSVFYIFFDVLLQIKTENYVPFLLVGLTVWQWFKSCLSHGAETILASHHLMQQVHLPKAIFPIILILTDSTKFVFLFILLLVFLWFYGYGVGLPYLALPAVLLVQFLFTASLTFLLAAIVPFLPDLRFVVENLLMAVFFMSGIFMSADAIPEVYRSYYYLNPIVSIIESYRDILMYNTWPSGLALLIIGTLSLIGIWLAVRLIARFEYVYPKVMQ